MTTPELPGMVEAMFDRRDDEGISLALVATQHGEVVVERYGVQPENIFHPELQITEDTTLTSWSMAKSITHAAVGLLVLDGLIDVDAPAAVPEWVGTPKADITVLQLLEMRSGLQFVEDYVDEGVSHCLEMLFGDSGPSHAAYAASLPLDHPPGTTYNYSSGTTNIIARIIGDIVAGQSGSDPARRRRQVDDWLRTRLFDPIGMASATPKFDGAGDFVGSSYVYATARDFARFGQLYLHDGQTSAGEQILPAGWSHHARGFSAHDPENGCDYGRHWWMWPEVDGSVVCHGHEGQYILVVPNRDLVIVHLGKTPSEASPQLRSRLRSMVPCF